VGDLVAFLGMIPEVPGVLDQLAGVVDQDVVDGNDALFAVAGGRLLLEPVQPELVEPLNVPVHLRQPAVQARLVGGVDEFPVDGRDILAAGHQQASQILGEVDPLRLVGEDMTERGQGFLDDLWEFDDRWHDRILPDPNLTSGRRYLSSKCP